MFSKSELVEDFSNKLLMIFVMTRIETLATMGIPNFKGQKDLLAYYNKKNPYINQSAKDITVFIGNI